MVKYRKQIEGRASRPVGDTPEQARIDCRLQSYDYTPGVFRKYFTSPYNQYAQQSAGVHRGQAPTGRRRAGRRHNGR